MKRIFLLAFLVMLLAPAAFAGQASMADPSAPFDLRGYASELGRWSASASRLREHPQEAAALRKQLPDHWSVALQGQHFLVSTEWLGAALDRLAANPKLAADTSQEMSERLESMLQDSQDLGRISEPNSGLARAKLDNILKRREFRSVRAAAQNDTFWNQITDSVWKFLDRVFTRVGDHPIVTKALLWVVVIVLSIVFLGWLIHSLANVSLANLWSHRLPTPSEAAAPTGTWREWVQHARAAAARGEYRDAIRILYGAAVRRIEEGGTWQVDPARTHRASAPPPCELVAAPSFGCHHNLL